jgi:hypothetical protein
VKNIVSVTRLCEEKESDVKPEIYKGSGAILDRTSSSSAFTPRIIAKKLSFFTDQLLYILILLGKIEKTFSIKREHSAPSIETFCRESGKYLKLIFTAHTSTKGQPKQNIVKTNSLIHKVIYSKKSCLTHIPKNTNYN